MERYDTMPGAAFDREETMPAAFEHYDTFGDYQEDHDVTPEQMRRQELWDTERQEIINRDLELFAEVEEDMRRRGYNTDFGTPADIDLSRRARQYAEEAEEWRRGQISDAFGNFSDQEATEIMRAISRGLARGSVEEKARAVEIWTRALVNNIDAHDLCRTLLLREIRALEPDPQRAEFAWATLNQIKELLFA